MQTFNLTAIVTLNSIPVPASIEAESLEEAEAIFEAQLNSGEHNNFIRNNVGVHFEIDEISED